MFFRRIRVIYFLTVLLAIFPTNANCVSEKAASFNEKGIKALGEGNYRRAIEYFKLALRDASGNNTITGNLSNAYNNYGLALFRRGQTLNAIDNFKSSLRMNPRNAYALTDLAQAYYKSGDIERAEDYLGKAFKIDPGIEGLAEFLSKVRRENKVEAGFRRIEIRHFILMSGEGLERENIVNIRVSVDGAYSRIGAFFGHYPKYKTSVVIYPESEYEMLMQGKPYWSHSLFDGKIRIPLAKKIYSEEYLKKIIYHEYTHAVVRELTKGNCPMWLSEGIACYSEGFVVPRDRSFFKEFITRENLIPINRIPEGYSGINNPRDANMLYREFYLIVSFIIDRHGSRALVGLLKTLGRGGSVDEALRENLSTGSKKFGEAWIEYVYGKLGI